MSFISIEKRYEFSHDLREVAESTKLQKEQEGYEVSVSYDSSGIILKCCMNVLFDQNVPNKKQLSNNA